MHWSLIPSVLPLFASATAIVLPSDTGPYRTRIFAQKITDQVRFDPYASDGRLRSLMLTIVSPVSPEFKCQNSTMRYMPDLSAAFYDQLYAPITSNGTFESFTVSTCSVDRESIAHDPCISNVPASLPVVIFSPGFGNSRLLYTAICQSIASHGMHVVAIDHPYDALGVEYPDGSYVLAANITTDEQIEQAIGVRVDDVGFVIDSLSNGTILPLPLADDHSQIFMLGHSLGGATALSAMLENSRILAGANMDGKFFPDILPKDTETTRPFLLIGNQQRNVSTDPTWDLVLRKYLSGPTAEYQISGTEHGSFTDLPLLLKAMGVDTSTLQQAENGIGSVDGLEILRLITDIVVSFFRDTAEGTTVKKPRIDL